MPIDNDIAAELGVPPETVALIERAIARRNGRAGGAKKSPRKLAASRKNGAKGGRPKKCNPLADIKYTETL